MVAAIAGPAAAAPPEVKRLFGCPLDAETKAFRPPDTWARHTLASVGVGVRLPPRWSVEEGPGVATLVDPRKDYRLTLRRARRVGADDLMRARRATEHAELGPSHAGAGCERRLGEALSRATGLRPLLVGVYRRPLLERRRSYAVYAAPADRAVTVILTASWSRRAGGPDLRTVRRLLGGLSGLAAR